MDVSAVIAIIGGIALLVGVFGGGIEAKEIKIPPIHATFRIVSFVIGVILILVAVITSKPEFLSLIPAKPAGTVVVAPPDPTKPLLSDNFDDSAYDGKYNTNLWNCGSCAFAKDLVVQDNNSVRLVANKDNGGSLLSQTSWLSYQIDYAQSKMRLQSTDSGEMNFGFNAQLNSSSPWFADCFIQGGQKTTQAVFGCSIFTYINGQYKGEYGTETFAVNYDEWYTAKIEIAQPTLEFRFYLDGNLIGQHTPVDADELKGKVLGFGLGITTDTQIIGFFDDVVVQPAK